MKFYSQYNQDKFILENYFQRNCLIHLPKGWSSLGTINTKHNKETLKLTRRDGYFVDIGAHDGVTFSNSKFFEELGWSGVCVEPNPSVFKKLKENRTSSTKCVMKAVSKEKKEDNFTFIEKINDENDNLNMLGGLTDRFTPNGITSINKIEKDPLYRTTQIKVNTDIFSNIITNREIDYLSIDTEGNELDILQTIDFNDYRIKMITVENNNYNNTIQDYLVPKNYKFITRLGCDELYIHNDYHNEINSHTLI
jgi:FkbM family methyltransferase